ncbi:MAG: 5'-nucleotidase C-terminal domain-containing protein [Oscillospiraceae bacterium]|nr:5'-nucleotidase C-terminal domain-containing protein [Oscillospiraceae bacterium]
MKKVLSLLLVLMLLLSILPTAVSAEEPKDIIIYFTNDVHGAYENYAYAAEIMKDGDFIVDAGDNIQGSVATSLTDGQCMVDIMNAVGYDVAIPGNHEFDFGFDRFMEIVNGEGNTPYISANVWDKVNDKSVLPAYKILEAGGKKIAFVGITTPETLVKSTPTFFQDAEGNWIYDFCNDESGEKLYKVVQDAIDAAKAEGADYVIAIGHLGIDEQSEPWTSTSVVANVSGLDALIDGHSHSTFSETKTDKDGKEVVVAQTGTKLANVGKLTIAADGTIDAVLIPVVADETAPFDATVAEAVAKIKGEIDEISNTVVAKTEVALTTKDPETGNRAVRNAETNLGDLCADAYRDLLKTDIAFVNGGGVRADLAIGDVTYGDIIKVHPFGNMACAIEVTGEQIWEALELGAAAYPGESGGFLQVSGIEYTINQAIPSPVIKDETGMFAGLKPGASHRVVDVKIGGEPLDPEKTYTLGGHNYMLKQCGDGYAMFKGCKVLQDEIAVDNEVLIRYIRDTLGGVVSADSIYANLRGEGRIKVIDNAEVFSVFFTNDVHGAYENYAYAAEIMKDGDFVVDAGDNIQGSVATSLTKGQCMVDIMNAVGYDLAIPGNHEFDFGFDRFMEIAEGENTPYISANVWDKVNDKSVLPAYKILEVGEKKVAFIGITTPETLVKSTPTFFQNEAGEWIYDFCNDESGEKLYKVVQDAIDAAKAEGADYVIAIGHLGIDEQSEPWTSTSVIKNVSGLDALIDGHSHSTFTEVKPDKDGKDVTVAQTGTKLANVGKLIFSADGSISAELIPVKAGEGVPYDETVAEAVAKVKADIDAISETVVAKTEVLLTTKDPDTGKRAVRNAETNLGDLCADAYRDLLGTDIAFVNGGGVRADIEAGDVTYGQIIAVHPFGNMACAIEVTGQQIWDALELGAAAYPGESGGFLQVSGLEYTINKAIPTPVIKDDKGMFVGMKEGAPHRVIDVKIGGEPLDVAKTYTLGGHNYMLKQCGDGYAMFKGCKVLQDEIAVDNEVLIRYIRDTLKGVVAADSIYANPRGAGRIKVIDEYPNPFTDVKDGDYFYDAVIWAVKNEVTKGTSDTTFSPADTCTRAQVVTFLWRAKGCPEPTLTENPFKDVKETDYFYKAVLWAVENEITNGIAADTFAPNAGCTRGQVVTFLWRAEGKQAPEKTENPFGDVKEGDFYYDAVLWAVEKEITKGTSDKTFSPNDTCTRGQIVTFLFRDLA